ncbi:hypothetical protein ACGFII_29865 [Micromonospora chalcea]
MLQLGDGHVVFDLLQQRRVVEFVVEQVGQRAVALLDLRMDPVAYRLGCAPAAEDTHAYVRAGILGEQVPYS